MIKRVISYLSALCIAFSAMASFNSFAYLEIDNDDSKGYSNINNGFNTYLSGSSHFRGDARRNYNSEYANYTYEFSGSGKSTTTSFKVKLYAYVNDSTFTNPSAKYVAYGNSSAYTFGTLNQDTAFGGWNYVGEATVKPLTQYGYKSVTCNAVGVGTNGPLRYTGADGVRVYF